MTAAEARAVLEKIAAAWSSGHPGDAAGCFVVDALYLEPPDRQRYEGRAALFDFFGGNDPAPPAMSMEWHGIAFNPETATAYGEYTFRGRHQYHGVAVVGFRDGLVASWREYQYRSDLAFASFAQLK